MNKSSSNEIARSHLNLTALQSDILKNQNISIETLKLLQIPSPQQKAIEALISWDDVDSLKDLITQWFFAWIKSDFAEDTHTRAYQAQGYLEIMEFLENFSIDRVNQSK